MLTLWGKAVAWVLYHRAEGSCKLADRLGCSRTAGPHGPWWH